MWRGSSRDVSHENLETEIPHTHHWEKGRVWNSKVGCGCGFSRWSSSPCTSVLEGEKERETLLLHGRPFRMFVAAPWVLGRIFCHEKNNIKKPHGSSSSSSHSFCLCNHNIPRHVVMSGKKPAVSCRWIGWVWEILTGWSWRLQEIYRSFWKNQYNIPWMKIERPIPSGGTNLILHHGIPWLALDQRAQLQAGVLIWA